MRGNPQRRITGRTFLTMAEKTYENGNVRDSLIDMLTDIRHYCAQAKVDIDFDKCVLMSEIHHNDEAEKD